MIEDTYVHPAVVVAMVLVAGLIFFLRKERVIVPYLGAAFLIPMDQVVVVGPFHFQMLRVLILFGWLRLLSTKLVSGCEVLSNGTNAIDRLVALGAVCDAFSFVLLRQDSEAVVNRLGALYTVLGIYVFLRFLIRTKQDIDRSIKALAYVCAVIAVVMMFEQATGRNPYVLLGGPRAFTRASLMAREGEFRAMAAFQHPILAGTFGAILLPLFVGFYFEHAKGRSAAVVGAVAATVIVVASKSSTPILAYLAGAFALCLWPLRSYMRLVRWGLVITVISFQMVMKAPFWALIQRVDLIGGNSSWHRYYLLDRFIAHFTDWWLFGVKNTDTWGPFMWDHANQYVAVGESSGLLPLILFIGTIVYGFKYVGAARRAAKSNRKRAFFSWALGAAVFANVVGFFGISYFDQTIVVWYSLLVMISVHRCVSETYQQASGKISAGHSSRTIGAIWCEGRAPRTERL
ncbi:MAG: hypothetical protein ACLQPN_00415 [Bryobacteraceae bacterium]